MNLKMIQRKNGTEGLLFSITKNCETHYKEQTRRKAEALEFSMTKSRETFHFNPFIILGHDSNWMVGLTNLEVYNSILNITEENNKFELYRIPDSKCDGISDEKVRDEIEKD